MAKSKLDKLLSLYREGYISRDELIRHSRKILPQRKQQPQPQTAPPEKPQRAPLPSRVAPAPQQPVIELDFPPLVNRFSIGQRGRSKFFPAFATVLVIASLSGWYYLRNGSIDLTQWKTRMATAIAPETPQQATDKLQRHAEQLMSSPQWVPAEVEIFTQHWAKLSTEQQRVLAESLWYKKFSLYLALQIAQLGSPALSNNADTKDDLEPLRQLSKRLGNEPALLQDPITKKATPIQNDPGKPGNRDDPINSGTDAEAVAGPETVADEPTSAPMPPPVVALTPPPAPKPRPPNPQELERLLLRYAYYYEGGQIKELMGLFTGSGWNQGEIGRYELQERYQETFAKTVNRKLQIDNVTWSFKGNAAFGTGKLKLTYSTTEGLNTEGLDTQEQVGNIRLVALREKDKLVFSHLYHIF